MSKKLILLFILGPIIGLAIAWFTTFNPITLTQTFIQNPSTILPYLNSAWQFIKQNIVGFITGVVGMFALAAKVLSTHKQQTRDNLNQIRSESSTAINQLSTKNQELETQLQQTTKTYSENFKEISANYVNLQNQMQDVQATNKQVIAERNYWANEAKKWEAKAKQPARVA